MKRKSHSSAVTRIALLTLIALGSANYGWEYYDKVATAEALRASAESELRKAEQSIGELQRFLQPKDPPVKAEAQLDSFIAAAWRAVEDHGLSAEVSVKHERGATGVMPMSSYFSTIPSTEVRTVRVSVTGRYSSYADFKAFLVRMQESGGFLSRIRVKENSFDLSFQVYGG